MKPEKGVQEKRGRILEKKVELVNFTIKTNTGSV